MFKKVKKFTFLVLLVLVAVLSLPACGRKASPNTTTDLEISYWISGFGKEYMAEVVNAFEKKNPQYKVNYRADASATTMASTLSLNEKNTVDLYFNSKAAIQTFFNIAENLDDVLSSKYGTETKTIAEKFNPAILNGLKEADGKVKLLSYAGSVTGIMYNADIIEDKGFKIPRTSQELSMLTIDLMGEELYPFIHYGDGNNGYYNYLYNVWQAQYSGVDYYTNNYLTLTDANGKTPSKDVYLSATDGRKQALEALATIITPDSIYPGSNALAYTSAQTHFVHGGAVMMVNGSWFQNEMVSEGAKDMNVKMMKMPVLSSVIEKCASVSNDEELAAVVSAVDAILDGTLTINLTGTPDATVTGTEFSVTEKDFNFISQARNLAYHNGSEHIAMIPNYSTAKQAAKDFLKFYYSDEGISLFVNATHQASTAIAIDESKIDQSKWNAFEKQQYKYTNELTMMGDTVKKSILYAMNPIANYANVPIIGSLSASNPGDRKTAAQLWTAVEKTINENWKNWLFNAGIKE